MFALLAILVLAHPLSVTASQVIKTFSNTAPTYYYDNLWFANGDTCGWKDGADWNFAASHAVPMCEWDFETDSVFADLYATNQIVAIDNRMLATAEGRNQYCGKGVKVYKPDGSEYISPGGDLFVWEGCQACADTNGGRVDFSAPDLMAMGGGSCGVGAGYKVEITDEQIIQPTGHPPPAPKGVDTWTGPGTPGGGQMAIAAYKAAQAGDVAQGNAKTIVPPAGLEPIAPNAKRGIVGGWGSKGSGEVKPAPANGSTSDGPVDAASSQQAGSPISSSPAEVTPAVKKDAPAAPGAEGVGANFVDKGVVKPIIPAAAPNPQSTAATVSGGNCVFGNQRCVGKAREVCQNLPDNKIDWDSDGPDCPGQCVVIDNAAHCT